MCSGIVGKHSFSDDCAVELSALSYIDQPECSVVDSSTVQFVISDEASDDRADKCSITCYYCYNRRRYSVVKQRTYVFIGYVIQVLFTNSVWV